MMEINKQLAVLAVIFLRSHKNGKIILSDALMEQIANDYVVMCHREENSTTYEAVSKSILYAPKIKE